MPSPKIDWIFIARMFTAPLSFMGLTVLSILTWIYITDRQDNKEFQKMITYEIRQGFSEIAGEFKTVRKDTSIIEAKVEAKLGFISGACCSEIRSKREAETSDSIMY